MIWFSFTRPRVSKLHDVYIKYENTAFLNFDFSKILKGENVPFEILNISAL